VIELATQEIGKQVMESNLYKIAKGIPDLDTNVQNLDRPMAKDLAESGKVPEALQGSFSDLNTMKNQTDMSYKEIKAWKPDNSPNIAKWFDAGGTIDIIERDGKTVWNYTNPEGITVSYIDGYPVFPPETKHPYIGDIDIGHFTGNREADKKIYCELLKTEYGLTKIPEGYVLHHDSKDGIMQLVKTEYHEEFTHAGGHSKFKGD